MIGISYVSSKLAGACCAVCNGYRTIELVVANLFHSISKFFVTLFHWHSNLLDRKVENKSSYLTANEPQSTSSNPVPNSKKTNRNDINIFKKQIEKNAPKPISAIQPTLIEDVSGPNLANICPKESVQSPHIQQINELTVDDKSDFEQFKMFQERIMSIMLELAIKPSEDFSFSSAGVLMAIALFLSQDENAYLISPFMDSMGCLNGDKRNIQGILKVTSEMKKIKGYKTFFALVTGKKASENVQAKTFFYDETKWEKCFETVTHWVNKHTNNCFENNSPIKLDDFDPINFCDISINVIDINALWDKKFEILPQLGSFTTETGKVIRDVTYMKTSASVVFVLEPESDENEFLKLNFDYRIGIKKFRDSQGFMLFFYPERRENFSKLLQKLSDKIKESEGDFLVEFDNTVFDLNRLMDMSFIGSSKLTMPKLKMTSKISENQKLALLHKLKLNQYKHRLNFDQSVNAIIDENGAKVHALTKISGAKCIIDSLELKAPFIGMIVLSIEKKPRYRNFEENAFVATTFIVKDGRALVVQ